MAKERSFNGEVRSLLKDAAKEFGFAVDSIRNEVIEKGWFDRKNLTPEVADQWARDDGAPEGMQGPQDFSRENVYGDDRDLGRDLAQDRDKEQGIEL